MKLTDLFIAKKRKIELDKKRKSIEEDIHRKFDQISEALQLKRENFIDRINATFHHKERQLNVKQEEIVRLLRAIEHAEQFTSCVEHIDKKESTGTVDDRNVLGLCRFNTE